VSVYDYCFSEEFGLFLATRIADLLPIVTVKEL